MIQPKVAKERLWPAKSFNGLPCCQLKYNRNNIAYPSATTTPPPIFKLSVELLGMIFYLLSYNTPEKYRKKASRYVSHVNRFWRSVAIEYKFLWRGPVLDWLGHPAWLRTVLLRSNPLPIDVDIPIDVARRHPSKISLAFKNFSRTRAFKLAMPAEEWWNLIKSNQLQQLASLLEVFDVEVFDDDDDDDDADNPIKITTPPKLFRSFAPRLQELSLKHCPLNLDMDGKRYHRLKILTMNTSQYLVEDYFRALRSMPNLEELYITRSPNPTVPYIHIPNTSNEEQTIIDDNVIQVPELFVQLPRLSRLFLSTTIDVCALLLRSLDIPESCSRELLCENATDGADLYYIIRYLKGSLASWHCSSLVARQSIQFDADWLKVTLAGPGEEGQPSPEHPYTSLKLIWPARGRISDAPDSSFWHGNLPARALSIFEVVSPPPQTLELSCNTKIPETIQPQIVAWLKKLVHIRRVVVQGGMEVFELFNPLFVVPSPSTDHAIARVDRPTEILLPKLAVITFHFIDFTAQRGSWNKLLEFLWFRVQVDRCIQTLNFRSCRIEREAQEDDLKALFGLEVSSQRTEWASDAEDEWDSDVDYSEDSGEEDK